MRVTAAVARRVTANGDAHRRTHRDGDDDGAQRAREPSRPPEALSLLDQALRIRH